MSSCTDRCTAPSDQLGERLNRSCDMKTTPEAGADVEDWALWVELTREAWRGRQDSAEVHPGSNTSARLLRGAQPPEFVYVIDLRYNVVILLTWRATWVHRSQSFNFISCWKEATWRNDSRKQGHPHSGFMTFVITDLINHRAMIRLSITFQRYCQCVASDIWFPQALARLSDE